MAPSAPREIMALLQQGLAFHRMMNLPKARAAYQKVLDIAPREPNANRFLGVIHLQTGDRALARRHLETAAASNPDDAETHYFLARLALDEGRLDAAEAAVAECLRRDPRHLNGLIVGAVAALALGRIDDALAGIDKALAVAPKSVDALANKCDILIARGDIEGAWSVIEGALTVAPRSPDLLFRRAKLHEFDNSRDRAYRDFKWAAEAKPGDVAMRTHFANAAIMVSDWPSARRHLDALIASRPDQKDASSIFNLNKIAWGASAETLLEQGRRECAVDVPPIAAPGTIARRGDRLRIGYVSSDLRRHAVGVLLAGVLTRHDRAAFDIVDFSILPDDPSDQIRQTIQAACSEVHFVNELRGRRFAELVAGRNIDIAVDLNGWTAHSYLLALCHRPAPVQMTYLGYPGTSGAGFIDYIVADRAVIPPGREHEFSEAPIRLPHSYLPFDGTAQPEPEVPSRAECRLPEDAVVFNGYNGSYKLTADLADSWARILARVPGSVLWLRFESEMQEANLRREFAARGVAPERLVFAHGSDSFARYFGRQRHAALFLDSFYYNAHTTGLDSLWSGVPIVTKVGPTFAGRVGASLLTTIGLEDLITTTVKDYEDTAVRLALDPAALAAVKDRLARARTTSPLFDSALTARHLESAFTLAFERHARGLAPEPFDVPDLSAAAGQAAAGR